ncbi:MAG: hypothetical protein HUJ91_05245 [Bacteroidales bacterium]|nr:hypothetical protein [Bacteroidales bacterium]
MRVVKSYGTEGGVIVSAPELECDLEKTEPVTIVFDGLPVPFFVEEFSPKGSTKYFLKLEDIDTLADAEELVGKEIFVGECDTEEADDLTGYTLFSDTGREIGPIDGLLDIPGNPCLEVGTKLFPCPDECIVKIDRRRRQIRLRIADGLLEGL